MCAVSFRSGRNPRKRVRGQRAPCHAHFDAPTADKKRKCRHCAALIRVSSTSTGSMNNHLRSCPKLSQEVKDAMFAKASDDDDSSRASSSSAHPPRAVQSHDIRASFSNMDQAANNEVGLIE